MCASQGQQRERWFVPIEIRGVHGGALICINCASAVKDAVIACKAEISGVCGKILLAKVVSPRVRCRITRPRQLVARKPFRKSNPWPLNEGDTALDLAVTAAVVIMKPIPAKLTATCIPMAL
jgi:hypothetical protein